MYWRPTTAELFRAGGDDLGWGYYVRVSTRGTAESGTPLQALNYISDGHDARRDPSFSDAELRYIARMDPGWKDDLEGGRVPLVGFGQLATHADHDRLTQEFEEDCHPTNCKRGTIGYKSITLTLPKEVSRWLRALGMTTTLSSLLRDRLART